MDALLVIGCISFIVCTMCFAYLTFFILTRFDNKPF